MRVEIERDGDGGVPETLLDDLGVDARLQRQGCPGMAEVMQSDARKAVAGAPAVELAGDPVGVVGAPVRQGEDQVVVVVGLAEGEALLVLELAPR